MKISVAMRLQILLCCVLGFNLAVAGVEWISIGTQDGVEMHQKVVHLNSGGFGHSGYYDEALGSFRNLNSYSVKISFTPVLKCKDGTEQVKTGYVMTIKSGQTQAGEGAGLWWRGCADAIRHVRFANVVVSKTTER